MESLKILNKQSYNELKDFLNKLNIEMNERSIIANSNFCYIISNYCNNKLETSNILEIYDYVTDVLSGNYPQIIVNVPKENRIIFAKKLIKKENKYGLTEEEIEFFAFCIVYSFFIYGINEETQDPEQAIYDFTSKEKVINQYEYAKKEKMWKFEIKEYSNPLSEDYGYKVENPIEVTSVSMEYSYLDALITLDNKEIFYDRIGSFEGPEGKYVDGYEIYIKGLFMKKKIATLYITGDGNEDSRSTPKGFKFK